MQNKILNIKTLLVLFVSIFTLSSCQNNSTESSSDENIVASTTNNSELEVKVETTDAPIAEENETVETTPDETIVENQTEKTTPSAVESNTKKEAPKTVNTTSKPQSTPTQTSNKPKLQSPKSETVETAPTSKKSNISIPKSTSGEIDQPKVRKPKPVLSHKIWDGLLRKYVSATGNVNYAGFKKDKAKLNQYLQLLADNPPSSSWSRNKQIAYWINAYNAFTVDLIVDNYPISSILKLDNGKTWYVKRITIGGKKYSLNDIEKNILIGKFKEGRVHFAINCAAKSCPPLKNRAWSENSLNSDLDKATKTFVNNTSFNQIKKKSATLSQIFNWYKADFGDVIPYINKYSNVQLSSKAKLDFNEYNWDLNK